MEGALVQRWSPQRFRGVWLHPLVQSSIKAFHCLQFWKLLLCSVHRWQWVSTFLKHLGTSAGAGGVNGVSLISVLTPAESSLSIPCPETPLIHFFLPDCSVPAITRLICTTSPAAHMCHYSNGAVTLKIYGPCSAPLSPCSHVQRAVPSPGSGNHRGAVPRGAPGPQPPPGVCLQLFCLSVHAEVSAVCTLSPPAHLSVLMVCTDTQR